MLQCANNYTVYAETPLQLFQKKLNFIWLIVFAGMVFFMQVGFTAFETGSVQAKNAISVAIKNILGFLVSSIMYFLLGFGIMFGASYEGYLGIIAILAKDFVEKVLKVNDPVGYVSVHGFCGVWGIR